MNTVYRICRLLGHIPVRRMPDNRVECFCSVFVVGFSYEENKESLRTWRFGIWRRRLGL